METTYRKVKASQELPDKNVIENGKQKEYICLRCGKWTSISYCDDYSNLWGSVEYWLEESQNQHREWEIDFNGHCKTLLSIKDNKPTIKEAMNGYGDGISKDDIFILQLA